MAKSIKIIEKKRARPLMVQGTSSHVGKSVITAALCRIFKDRGFRAAPFKSQNMALNSFVTACGGEIGRAQAFQAEAAGVEPSVDMNPVLLKPSGDSRSQVIIQGRVYGSMSAAEYHAFKRKAAAFVLESYDRLSLSHDVIIIEGAGSPAEVNLREGDIANMGMAEIAESPVVLVSDIDRGGVFASIVGTMELLTDAERERVKGFIINKFRGDVALLRPGVEFLERRTGRPVLGVVPYMKDMMLPDEDGAALTGERAGARVYGGVRIAVIRLPRISNFTDFDPFRHEPGVSLEYIDSPSGLTDADMAVIPGTKNTIEDLLWLKERGFEGALKGFISSGGAVFGICGGFQMLGRSIKDPHGMESAVKSAHGLNLTGSETTMMREKASFQVIAEVRGPSGETFTVKGYEIHMGETTPSATPFGIIRKRGGAEACVEDGVVSGDGRVWGTYIHGIFDNDGFRASIIEGLGWKKGSGVKRPAGSFISRKEASLAALARTVEESLDIAAVCGIMGLE